MPAGTVPEVLADTTSRCRHLGGWALCPEGVRIAIVAESFLPSVNGVTTSVLHVAHHLAAAGHQVNVIAAAPARGLTAVALAGCQADVSWLPSLAVPGYPTLRWAAPGVARLRGLLADLAPDVVHLAAPFVLGWDAVRAARSLGIPTVAVYQTDVPSYAAHYGIAALEPWLWSRVRDIHGIADRTLAPSSSSANQLRRQHVPRVHRWARGVDASSFHPDRRDPALRREWAPNGEVLVGYVGRLAAEKQVEDLRLLEGLDGARLIVIGDGPRRLKLERMLPSASFCGWRGGADLARAVASLDVVVHPGQHDTFGQTIQEAMASGVPVVAVAQGGPLDLVEHGRTGLLYPVGRLDLLRDQVTRLLLHPDERRDFGVAGRAVVRDRSWSRMTQVLLQHYLDVSAVANLPVAV